MSRRRLVLRIWEQETAAVALRLRSIWRRGLWALWSWIKPHVVRASAFVLVLFVVVFPGRAATAVVIVDLGTLGGSYSHATAVSASGRVVGDSSTVSDAETHAFCWTQAGGMIDLAPSAALTAMPKQ
jgi:probable HAF family extracellular repeat protein